MKARILTAIALSLTLTLTVRAQVPGILNYQGRIVDNGTNFTGTGLFEFALVNPGGTTNYWSNDGTAIGQPALAVSLTVTKGLYSVLLGDTTVSNMTTAVPAAVFANSNVLLRVWFNDGVTGFQQLIPDQRIAAVGYAMMAASVPNGAIASVQLASNAVTAANLAAGAVTTVAIANGAVGANQLAINSVNSLIQSNLASTVAASTNNTGLLYIERFNSGTNNRIDFPPTPAGISNWAASWTSGDSAVAIGGQYNLTNVIFSFIGLSNVVAEALGTQIIDVFTTYMVGSADGA
ncbi:MAG: hypothetical protein ACLQDC_15050, partial [Verrucomicrobiia bacterium]